ncbi:hypothetical protein JMN32_14590 [Fulvivirga sp. 29W222]|uniref:Uncharacterized protein n=1 Tax=Fulvivirga marina TaxID=2494733 RepID=A0A937KEV2_9BACT|nr:hypothetical protein [Fulvivirga marina]MBL6447543.1 hypothetical protein [Fulvivirga marina]
MKKVLSLLAAFGVMFCLSSCGDDDDPVADNGVTITGIPATATIDNLGTYTGTATLEAKDGLAALAVTKGGAAFDAETYAGETSATYAFSYTAEEADADSNITFTFTATDADGDTEVFTHVLSVGDAPTPLPNEVLSGLITANKTLTADRIWELAGRVIVTDGATLTIEPGTIIKGRPGEGTNASVLMIARDGMINAEGTADMPIIFTATADNIAVGQKKGTNLDAGDNELWGGVVILGNAPISPDAGTTAQIEGVPASEPLGQYGGNVANDNRGILKYASIRHGGTTIDAVAGNDINGLTLGGVGSGTTISHIEIFANFDDGVEFFGGSVNITNLLVYTVGDDAIDVDQAYSGTVSNFLVFTSTAASSDEGLEIDGPEGAENSTGKFTIQNGTITSVDGGGSAADFKSKAQGTVNNVKYSGFTGGATIKIRASFDPGNSCADKTDAYTNLIGDNLVFTTIEFSAVSVYDGDGADACDVPASYQTSAAGKVSSTSATGASDASVFDAWSAASISALL